MQYVVSSTAWPQSVWKEGDERLEDIILSFDEGSSLSLIHYNYNGGCWKLEAFDDAWVNLKHIQDLLLPENEGFTVEQMIAKLRDLGFRPDFEYHGQMEDYEPNLDELHDLAKFGDEDALRKLYLKAKGVK